MDWEVELYATEAGRSPVEDFLSELSEKAQAKCLKYFELLQEHGTTLPRNYAAHVRNDVWELRPEYGGTEYRFFYFAVVGRKFVVVHAITKTTQQLKSRDIGIAEARVADYRRRSQASKKRK